MIRRLETIGPNRRIDTDRFAAGHAERWASPVTAVLDAEGWCAAYQPESNLCAWKNDPIRRQLV
jgi:hypothetical protein